MVGKKMIIIIIIITLRIIMSFVLWLFGSLSPMGTP